MGPPLCRIGRWRRRFVVRIPFAAVASSGDGLELGIGKLAVARRRLVIRSAFFFGRAHPLALPKSSPAPPVTRSRSASDSARSSAAFAAASFSLMGFFGTGLPCNCRTKRSTLDWLIAIGPVCVPQNATPRCPSSRDHARAYLSRSCQGCSCVPFTTAAKQISARLRCYFFSGRICPRISPSGYCSVMTLTYHWPARTWAACTWVSVTPSQIV
jgi:hypothetical protein